MEERLERVRAILEQANEQINQLDRPASNSSVAHVDEDEVGMRTIASEIAQLVQRVDQLIGSERFSSDVASQLDHVLSTAHQTHYTLSQMIYKLLSIRVHDQLSDDEFREHVNLFVDDVQRAKQVYNMCQQRMEDCLRQFDLQECDERKGAFVDLNKYIEFVVKSSKYEPGRAPYKLKFEMDAACVSKTKKNMNAVAFEIIAPSTTTVECMCPRNAHVFCFTSSKIRKMRRMRG